MALTFATKPDRTRDIDPGLWREIRAIDAIDDHAHPLPLGLEPKGDPDHPIQPYDTALPARMRPFNPEYVDAWADLWGYEHRDWEKPHLAALIERKEAMVAGHGAQHNVWVLDKLKLSQMIAVAYGPSASEPAPRFRWIAFSDWFLWPFPSEPKLDSPLLNVFLNQMKQKCGQFNNGELPQTLEGFLQKIVMPTLDLYAEQGSVGIKFQTPYYRPIHFLDPTKAEAESLYARGAREGSLSQADHKALQDYIFRFLMDEAGRRDFVVQMHTGIGVKPYFDVAGSNPMLMEPIFHSARNTKFLLLHGGYPFDHETTCLLAHDNVYTDFSCANIYHHSRFLAERIRAALEWYPEKIMYGTDAYSDRSIGMLGGMPVKPNPLSGWEEKAWLMDRTGREALGLALTAMHHDGVVSADGAEHLMQSVMRGAATALYQL